MSTLEPPCTLHVRIGRLVVERDALGDISSKSLGAAVEAALSARLTHAPTDPFGGLVSTIADAVAPAVAAHLPDEKPHGTV